MRSRGDHRLVDERRQQPGDVGARRCRRPAHTCSARSRSNDPGEDRQPFEERAARLGVSSSYDHCDEIAQLAVAGIGRAPRAGQHAEALGQPLRELRRRSSSACAPPPARARAARRRAGCRSPRPRAALPSSSSKSCRAGAGPLDEQLHRGHLGRGRPAAGRAIAGTGSGGTDHTSSAGMPSGSRLVASTCTLRAPLQDQLDELAGGVEHVLAVVEHEEQVARRQHLDDRVGERAVAAVAARRAQPPTAAVTAPWSRTGASSTRRTPSANVGATVVADGGAEAGLADSTGAEQREDAAGLEQPRRQLEVVARGRRAVSSPTGTVATRASTRRLGARRRAHLAGGTHASSSRSSRIAASRSRSVGRRLEAEVVAQRGAEVLRRPQRLGLAARAVEGEHQLAGELLAQRMVDEQRLELGRRRFVVTADAELGVDPAPPTATSRSSSSRIASGRIHSASANSANAAPRHSAERGVELLERRRPGRRRSRRLALGEPALEAAGVDAGRRAPRARSRARGSTQGGAVVAELHEPPQPRHVALERRARPTRAAPPRAPRPAGRSRPPTFR